MAKLFANSGDPDQTLYFAVSDLDLHFSSITLLGVNRLHWVIDKYTSGYPIIPAICNFVRYFAQFAYINPCPAERTLQTV